MNMTGDCRFNFKLESNVRYFMNRGPERTYERARSIYPLNKSDALKTIVLILEEHLFF